MAEPRLIGRQQELDTLLRAIEDAAAARGSVVLLSGEAGLGKTLLARAALARCPHTVLSGRARPDVVTPYGPIATALRMRLRDQVGSATKPTSLSPFLSLLLPELGPAPADPGPEVLVEAIVEGLLASSDAQTTILLLEDLQWADNATLALVPLLAERLDGASMMMVLGTYRSDEVGRGHPLRRMRQELRRSRLLEEIVVSPLDRDGTAELLDAALSGRPAEALIELIHRHSQGIPLYAEELASALQESGRLVEDDAGRLMYRGDDLPVPESVRDSVLLRLDVLSEAARHTLEIASLVGVDFNLELVASLAGSETGIEELLDHRLLEESGTGMGRFRHALIREVIRNEIAWSQRRSLSSRIATWLARAGAPPEQVAEHWLTARELEPACKALLEVADRSCRLHAYQDAATAAHRALENWPDSLGEPERVDTLLRLAHCAQVGGQLGDAVRALREAASSSIVRGDPTRAAIIQRDLGTIHGLQGARSKSLEAHRQAAEGFEAIGQFADASSEWLAVAGAQTASSALESALKTLQRAEDQAQRAARQDLLVRARGTSGNVLAMLGRFEEGRDRAQKALSLALEIGESDAAAEAYRRLASVLDYSSDFAGSRDAYATAVNYCRTQGDSSNMTVCLGCMSAVVYRTGEWKRSLDIVKEIARSPDAPVGSRAIAQAITGLIQANRGELRPARRTLQAGQSLLHGHGIRIVELMCQFGLALVAEFDGDIEEAERLHQLVLDGWRDTEDHHDLVPVFLWQATFFNRLGAEGPTTQRAEVLSQLATSTGNHENLAALAHALGEVALLASDHDKAIEHFDQALQHVDQLDIPLERALTVWRSGVAHAHAGRREVAIDRLQSSYRLLRKLGARPIAERVRHDIEDLGEAVEEGRTPDRRTSAQRGGLTRRQVEIVRLLAQGFTNKEIASRLFLSSRTVDMHVSNILDRLDCAGRTEAARKAASLGLLDPDRPSN
jgi:DNA-binding CsgD family transcriptional regulator